MRKSLLLIAMQFSVQCITAQNTWLQKTNFGGVARYGAVGFSIGTKGYMGTGFDGGYKKDFWEYDPVSDTWTQKADFGGGERKWATGFSIGAKGYIGTGSDASTVFGGIKKDFWEYDPSTNTWAQKADFSGIARNYAIGFGVGTKGYIGTGYDGSSHLKDFWEYDPAADSWTKKTDFGGPARSYAVGFGIGTKGYVGTGSDGNVPLKDFWEYGPSTDAWTKKTDFGGNARIYAVAFGTGAKGYIGTGYGGGNIENDFWEYDASADSWAQKKEIGGEGRRLAVGFGIGAKGYIGTGYNDNSNNYKKDLWEYTPASQIMPVTLTNVRAYQKSAGIEVEWTAQLESNMDHYDVERSQDGRHFDKIGGSAAKNYNTSTSYSLFDPAPFIGAGYYRIATVDKSGQVTYSLIVKVDIGGSTVNMISVYPNPLKGNTVALRMNLVRGSYNISLTSRLGQLVTSKVIEYPGGISSQTITPSQILAAGVYQLRVTGNGVNIIRQVIKN